MRDTWSRSGRNIPVWIQREDGIRDRRIVGARIGGSRGWYGQDHHWLAPVAWGWIQVEVAAAVDGVVVDRDHGVVERRNPFRPDQSIVVVRPLLVREPQRIERFDVRHRRRIGV